MGVRLEAGKKVTHTNLTVDMAVMLHANALRENTMSSSITSGWQLTSYPDTMRSSDTGSLLDS